MQVRIDGKLSMYFYDIEAGTHTLKSTRIPPRSSPHMLDAVVDASNVPTGRLKYRNCLHPKQGQLLRPKTTMLRLVESFSSIRDSLRSVRLRQLSLVLLLEDCRDKWTYLYLLFESIFA